MAKKKEAAAKSKTKPQLHWSGLNMLWMCGEQYRRVYIEGDREPPGVALLIGSTCHTTAGADLKSKVSTGQLLKTKEIADLARDQLNRNWDERPVALDEKERDLGPKKVRGQAVDLSVRLAELHHTELAPDIEPDKSPRTDADGKVLGCKGLDRPWVVNCENYPFDLAGEIDLVEIDTVGPEPEPVIRDLKTASQTPNQAKADQHDQFTCYGLAYKVIEGAEVGRFGYDALVKLKTPKAVTLWTTRDAADYKLFMARFENACQAIEKGIFVPVGRDHWKCSEKYCGFFHTCPYAKGRLTMAVL